MKKKLILLLMRNEHGAVAIITAVFLTFIGIGITAFVIDFGYRHVAQNQLQNAADAGALAGARALYYDDASKVNDDGLDPTDLWTKSANEIGRDAAVANISAGTPVEVNWTSGNVGDVQRGHWSFGLLYASGGLERGFYPRNDTAPVVIAGVSEADLDNNEHYINAVKVVTRRQASPVKTFFGKIFGWENFPLQAEAVAWLGFAGTLEPEKVDQPIAICARSIWNDANNNGKLDEEETLTCNIGRMLDSGSNIEKFNTGGWTDFNQQDNPCKGGTNDQDVGDLVCVDGNPQSIIFGQDMATNGGVIADIFKKGIVPCWEAETGKTEPWPMVLPVIDCQDPNIGTCEEAIGAVAVNVIWIIEQNDSKCGKELPVEMSNVPSGNGNFYPNWTRVDAVVELTSELSRTPTDCEVWNHFADNFNLKNLTDVAEDGTLIFGTAPYAQKSIYFAPNCDVHQSGGTTGGVNFGVRADIPVIVNIPGKDKLNL